MRGAPDRPAVRQLRTPARRDHRGDQDPPVTEQFGGAPTAVATTGRPAAIASITALLIPSWSGEDNDVGSREQGSDLGAGTDESHVEAELPGLSLERGTFPALTRQDQGAGRWRAAGQSPQAGTDALCTP